MNARKFMNVRLGLSVTALALSGALALSAASCAGSGDGGTGGSSSTGGNSSTGGSSGGGNSGTGGSTSTAPGGDSVSFKDGKAAGAMTGYGWVALGALDKISSPKCAPDSTDTTTTRAISAPGTDPGPCPATGTTVWGSADALCLTGSIPALPDPAVQSDYDNNWGVQVGVNASETEGAEIGTAFSTVALTFAGKPTTGLRASVHLKGDQPGTTYCYNGVTSGKALKLTDFITTCWDGASCTSAGCKALTADMAKNIDKVGLQVSSTTAAITVDNLCLSGIQFTK